MERKGNECKNKNKKSQKLLELEENSVFTSPLSFRRILHIIFQFGLNFIQVRTVKSKDMDACDVKC